MPVGSQSVRIRAPANPVHWLPVTLARTRRVQYLVNLLQRQEKKGIRVLAKNRGGRSLAPLPKDRFEPPPLLLHTEIVPDVLEHFCLLECGESIDDTQEAIIKHYSTHYMKREMIALGLGPRGRGAAVRTVVIEHEEVEVADEFYARIKGNRVVSRYACRRGCVRKPMGIEQIVFHNLSTHRQLQHVMLRDPQMGDPTSGIPELYFRLFPTAKNDTDIRWEQGMGWVAQTKADWQQVLL